MKYDEKKKKNMKYDELKKKEVRVHSIRVSKVCATEMSFSSRSTYLESLKIEVLKSSE